MMEMKDLIRLADVAKPINHEDWGSERQVTAENRFFEVVFEYGLDHDEEFCTYAALATTEERIEEALKRVGLLHAKTARARSCGTGDPGSAGLWHLIETINRAGENQRDALKQISAQLSILNIELIRRSGGNGNG